MGTNQETVKKRKSDTGFILQGSILAAASIISRVIGLIYRVPLTNIIGKTGNDYYGTAYEIYNLLLIISSYSIPLAVSKLVAARMAKHEAKNARKVLTGALIFAGCSGGIAGIIMYFYADFFCGDLLKTPMAAIALRVLAPTLFIAAIVGVMRGFFQGLNTMVPTAFSQIMEQIVNAIVSVLAAYLLFSYGGRVGAVLGNQGDYAAAYGAAGGTLGTTSGAIMAFIIMLTLHLAYRKKFRKKIRRDTTSHVESYRNIMKVLIITIIPVLLSTTLYNFVNILDQSIFKNMAVFQGYSARRISLWWGVYTGEYRVIQNIPMAIASAMASSVVPSLTQTFHEGNMVKVCSQIHSATRFIMMIAFPSAVGMFVMAKPILVLLFHDPDPTSSSIMMAGAITVLVFSLSTLSNGLLQGIDQLRLPVVHAGIALVIQAIVLWLSMAVFHMNIYAMIVANTFYGLAMCVLNARSIRKYSGTRQNFRTTYLMPLIAALIMGVSTWLCYHGLYKIVPSNAFAAIISIVVAVIVYAVALIRLGGITEEEMRRIPKGTVLIRIAKKCHLL